MAWKHEVDKEMATYLGSHNRRLARPVVEAVVEEARKVFGLPPISLKFHDHHAKWKYGDATRIGGGREYVIRLYPKGTDVVSVLHELAHCFPDGYNHHIGWTFAFMRLTLWFVSKARELLAAQNELEDAL